MVHFIAIDTQSSWSERPEINILGGNKNQPNFRTYLPQNGHRLLVTFFNDFATFTTLPPHRLNAHIIAIDTQFSYVLHMILLHSNRGCSWVQDCLFRQFSW